MIDDGTKRINAIKRYNSAWVNLKMARERERQAAEAVARIEDERVALRVEYTELHTLLLSLLSWDVLAVGNASAERVATMDAVNAKLAVLEAFEPASAKARSECGTAAAEVKRFEEECAQFADQIRKLLPEQYLTKEALADHDLAHVGPATATLSATVTL